MMNSEEHREKEQDLQVLFQRYREVCPDPDASANFMPGIWQKIEARQSTNRVFGRLAGGFVSFAMAVSAMLALFVFVPAGQNALETGSYVEILAADHADDNGLYFDAVNFTPAMANADQDPS